MRDRLLDDSLTRLASEAAIKLSALVAGGDQIPFDVDAESGDDSLFYSYRPLTSRYVRERDGELRELDSFRPAREAVAAAGIAAAYLEARGEQVPGDPGERAAQMLTVFLAGLWDGCTELSLDHERLRNALAVLEAETRGAEEADVLIAPLVGLRMPLPRLQLPNGVQIVRADTIEAPIEAMRSEGMGRPAWQPQFLALAEQGEGAESAAAALDQLRELISVMHLFKPGSVGLGPYAFAPTGEDRWARLATGAPATRPGAYELSEENAIELAEFAAELEARPDPDGALAWAVNRFEMGCGRDSSLEGLSDHLLALRAVLDGHGPVGASLPMRAAALIADENVERIEARERIESALELERSLMNGSPSLSGLAIADWIEQGVRRILRETALGELSKDLNKAADESLIVAGLDGGDSSIAVAAAPAAPGREAEEAAVDETSPEPDADHSPIPSEAGSGPAIHLESPPSFELPHEEEHDMNQETRILEPIPAEGEIRITATPWLDEVDAPEHSTLDFPAIEGDLEHRERIDTPRVRHLFPVPEDADWEVRELKYNRRRQAG
ncbi:MAG TPA: hypothetical protein VJQ84_05245 [Solirubrobacterales bacterium]|nr:hypothetical protein [Solirubrobacterales bacterium]